MPRTYKIFVSSVQKELEAERRAIKEFIERELVLSMFFKDVKLPWKIISAMSRTMPAKSLESRFVPKKRRYARPRPGPKR